MIRCDGSIIGLPLLNVNGKTLFFAYFFQQTKKNRRVAVLVGVALLYLLSLPVYNLANDLCTTVALDSRVTALVRVVAR